MPSYGANSRSLPVPVMLRVVAYANDQPLKRNPRNMHLVSLDASPTAVSDALVMAQEMLAGTSSSAVVSVFDP